jgi:hypothetical protein
MCNCKKSTSKQLKEKIKTQNLSIKETLRKLEKYLNKN